MKNETESTYLNFSDYCASGRPETHLHDGFESPFEGTPQEVFEHLQSLWDQIPEDEESLSWEGQNGYWYAGDAARNRIREEQIRLVRDAECWAGLAPDMSGPILEIALAKSPETPHQTTQYAAIQTLRGNPDCFEEWGGDAPEDAVDAYLECALWASTDDDGRPMDRIDNPLDESVRVAAERDLGEFYAAIRRAGIDRDDWSDEQLGCDFWLSRNGHGAGFLDRGFYSDDALQSLAKTFGQRDLYIGDDGKIHIS